MKKVLGRFRRRASPQTGPSPTAEVPLEPPVDDTSLDYGPEETYVPPIERKIHPNLNALAAELEEEVRAQPLPASGPGGGHGSFGLPELSIPGPSAVTDPSLPISPKSRRWRGAVDNTAHHPSAGMAPPVSVMFEPGMSRVSPPGAILSAPAEQDHGGNDEDGEGVEEFGRRRLSMSSMSNSNSASGTGTGPTESSPQNTTRSRGSSTNPSPLPETRAKRIFTRLTIFGQRSIPTPPSAWSTFGRKTVGERSSIPHISDFGEIGPSSRPTSQPTSTQQSHSRKASQSHSYPHSISGTHPHSRSSTSHGPGHPQSESSLRAHPTSPSATSIPPASTTPPSSGFTFGSQAFGHNASSPTSPVPPLHSPQSDDNQLWRSDERAIDGRRPRPSASLPSMSSSSNPWISGFPTRPNVHEIFKGARPSTSQGSSGRAHRRRLSGSGDSPTGTRRRRRRNESRSASMRGRTSAEMQRENVSGDLSYFGNKHSSTNSSIRGIGSSSRVQGEASGNKANLYTSTAAQDHANDNVSIDMSQDNQNRSTDPKGKGKERMVTSYPSDPPTPPPKSDPTTPPTRTSKSPPPKPGLPEKSPSPVPPLVDDPRTPSPVSKSSIGKGKRKADEIDVETTPPDVKKDKQPSDGSGKPYRATFANDPRPHRQSATSGSSHAPSSYHRKRAKLSGSTYTGGSSGGMPSVGEGEASGSGSGGHRPASRSESRFSSWSHNPFRTHSRTSVSPTRAQFQHGGPHSRTTSSGGVYGGYGGQKPHRASSRRSLSQASIPISALISPHAPSVSQRSATYHMRDPRRPPRIQSTPWSLSFPQPSSNQRGYMSHLRWRALVNQVRGRRGGDGEKQHAERVGWTEGGGSPVHAWLFFLGFVVFPIWWVAATVVRIPRTRRIGHDGQSGSVEKGVVLDDPQVEHDAKSWRRRCRIMAVVSLFTYVPFIILVAIFAPKQ